MNTREEFEAIHGPTRLYRSMHGEVIHTAACRYGRIPWVWAEDRDDAEIARIRWLKPCAKCKPYVKAPS